MASDTQQYSNRFQTVSKLLPDLRSIESKGYSPYAITMTFKQPDHGWSLSETDTRASAVYFRLAQTLADTKNCHRPMHRDKMPYLVSLPELDGTGRYHHHGILYVRHDLAGIKMPGLLGIDTLCPLHDLVRTSCIENCTGLEDWLKYISKQTASIDYPLWCAPKVDAPPRLH